jgi:hypothetical protein
VGGNIASLDRLVTTFFVTLRKPKQMRQKGWRDLCGAYAPDGIGHGNEKPRCGAGPVDPVDSNHMEAEGRAGYSRRRLNRHGSNLPKAKGIRRELFSNPAIWQCKSFPNGVGNPSHPARR